MNSKTKIPSFGEIPGDSVTMYAIPATMSARRMYVVNEESDDFDLRVFDLRQLRSVFLPICKQIWKNWIVIWYKMNCKCISLQLAVMRFETLKRDTFCIELNIQIQSHHSNLKRTKISQIWRKFNSPQKFETLCWRQLSIWMLSYLKQQQKLTTFK